jgi:hypothetical protein
MAGHGNPLKGVLEPIDVDIEPAVGMHEHAGDEIFIVRLEDLS